VQTVRSAALFLMTLVLAATAAAQEAKRDAHVEARLIARQTHVQPGQPIAVGLHMKMDEHWHTYWRNPGDAGLATQIDWQLPDGFAAGEIGWPTPIKFGQEMEIIGYGYEGHVVLPVTVQTPEAIDADHVTLKATVEWLACADVCVPGKVELTLTLPVDDAAPEANTDTADLFTQTDALLPREVQPKQVLAWRDGGAIKLSFDLPDDWTDALSLEFFPFDAEQIDDVPPQPTRRDGDSVMLTLQPSKFGNGKTQTLRGLLVLHDGEQRAGWRINETIAASRKAALATADEATTNAEAPGAANEDRAVQSGEQAAPKAANVVADGAMFASLLPALLSLFLGGLILNLMPCVFPVLAIKIMGFVEVAGEDRGKVALHGLVYGGGVMASFAVLAVVVIVLQSGGEAVGWGFQMQDPRFIAAMALLLFAIGLNFLGVFEIGAGLMNLAGKVSSEREIGGFDGSFFTGVLTVLIATPCAAPFLAPALGYALTLSPLEIALALLTMGFGLALPYVLLSIFPQWLKLLPKPGAWMETFKQLMAFPMFGFAVWLVAVFAAQTAGATPLLVAMLTLAFGLWLYGRYATSKLSSRRVLARAGGFGVIVAAFAVSFIGAQTQPPIDSTAAAADPDPDAPLRDEHVTDAGELVWEPWSPQRVQRYVDAGRPVFVDFTADWCFTCKVNERTFIATDPVAAAVREYRVALLKADWTRKDPIIRDALADYGVRSVPLYVFHSPTPGTSPIVTSSLFSAGKVVESIEQIAPTAQVSSAAPATRP